MRRFVWLVGATFHAMFIYPCIFLLGFTEGRGDMGMTYDDDATSPRSRAYDLGRNLRRVGQ